MLMFLSVGDKNELMQLEKVWTTLEFHEMEASAIFDCGWTEGCPSEKNDCVSHFGQGTKSSSVYVEVTKPCRCCSDEWEQNRKSGDVIVTYQSVHRETSGGTGGPTKHQT